MQGDEITNTQNNTLVLKVLSSSDTGRDIVSVSLLLSKHKHDEETLDGLGRNLDALAQQGQQLQDQGLPGMRISAIVTGMRGLQARRRSILACKTCAIIMQN